MTPARASAPAQRVAEGFRDGSHPIIVPAAAPSGMLRMGTLLRLAEDVPARQRPVP